MGFLQPKVSAAPAPPPPTIEDTQAREQEYQDQLRRRRGRASLVLADQQGDRPTTASKVLLGQ